MKLKMVSESNSSNDLEDYINKVDNLVRKFIPNEISHLLETPEADEIISRYTNDCFMAGDSAEDCSDIIIARVGRITPKKTTEVEINSNDDSLKECDQVTESITPDQIDSKVNGENSKELLKKLNDAGLVKSFSVNPETIVVNSDVVGHNYLITIRPDRTLITVSDIYDTYDDVDEFINKYNKKSESFDDYEGFEKDLYGDILMFISQQDLSDRDELKKSLKDDIIDFVYELLNLDSVAQVYEYENIIDDAIKNSKIFEQEINEMTVSNSNPIVKDRGEDKKCYVTAYELTPIPGKGKEYYDEERLNNTQTKAIYLGNSSAATPSSFYLIPLDNGSGATDEFFAFNTFVRAETDNGGYIAGFSGKPAELSIGVTSPKSLTKRVPDPYDAMVAALRDPDLLDYLGLKSDDSKKDLDDKELIKSYTGTLGVLKTEPGTSKKRIK